MMNLTSLPFATNGRADSVVIYAMLIITVIGCLGNLVSIATILLVKRFRKSSTAFICHQCFLDLARGLYTLLFGFYLLHNTPVPSCNTIGASYVLFVTVAAYNLLAIVVNEECEMQRPSANRDNNTFCVIFGIMILWFTCFLIHMGVAFLPKEPEYIPGVGSCIFSYGTPSNLVLHILWIILISMAIFMTLLHFLSMYCRVRYKAKSIKWALIHRSLLRDVFTRNQNNDLDSKTVQRSCHSNDLYTHLYLKRIKVLTLMVVTFILFWYPLFLLTIIDHDYGSSVQIYKGLTILSWCHPATTPIFTVLILKDMASKDGLMQRIYSNVYPMMQYYNDPENHQNLCNEWDALHSGILNTHFSSENTQNDLSSTQNDLEGQTLLKESSDTEDLGDSATLISNDITCTIQTPLIIEQWDCSPTSPGKQRKHVITT